MWELLQVYDLSICLPDVSHGGNKISQQEHFLYVVVKVKLIEAERQRELQLALIH